MSNLPDTLSDIMLGIMMAVGQVPARPNLFGEATEPYDLYKLVLEWQRRMVYVAREDERWEKFGDDICS